MFDHLELAIGIRSSCENVKTIVMCRRDCRRSEAQLAMNFKLKIQIVPRTEAVAIVLDSLRRCKVHVVVVHSNGWRVSE